MESPDLKYQYLNAFEKEMVQLAKDSRLLGSPDRQLYLHNDDKVLVYEKGDAIFVFNLHPEKSFEGYGIPMPAAGEYQVVMSTDDFCFGGQGRVYHQKYTAGDERFFQMYLPSRTATVLKKLKTRSKKR